MIRLWQKSLQLISCFNKNGLHGSCLIHVHYDLRIMVAGPLCRQTLSDQRWMELSDVIKSSNRHCSQINTLHYVIEVAEKISYINSELYFVIDQYITHVHIYKIKKNTLMLIYVGNIQNILMYQRNLIVSIFIYSSQWKREGDLLHNYFWLYVYVYCVHWYHNYRAVMQIS